MHCGILQAWAMITVLFHLHQLTWNNWKSKENGGKCCYTVQICWVSPGPCANYPFIYSDQSSVGQRLTATLEYKLINDKKRALWWQVAQGQVDWSRSVLSSPASTSKEKKYKTQLTLSVQWSIRLFLPHVQTELNRISEWLSDETRCQLTIPGSQKCGEKSICYFLHLFKPECYQM